MAKWLSWKIRRPAGLLFRGTVSNICRENVGLTKLSPDSTLYLEVVGRRGYSSSLFAITYYKTSSRRTDISYYKWLQHSVRATKNLVTKQLSTVILYKWINNRQNFIYKNNKPEKVNFSYFNENWNSALFSSLGNIIFNYLITTCHKICWKGTNWWLFLFNK
jgi:hypothetical protein